MRSQGRLAAMGRMQWSLGRWETAESAGIAAGRRRGHLVIAAISAFSLSPQVLAVKAKRGNAVLFHSIKPSGELERRSLHTAWWVAAKEQGLCCVHAVLCPCCAVQCP